MTSSGSGYDVAGWGDEESAEEARESKGGFGYSIVNPTYPGTEDQTQQINRSLTVTGSPAPPPDRAQISCHAGMV